MHYAALLVLVVVVLSVGADTSEVYLLRSIRELKVKQHYIIIGIINYYITHAPTT